MKKICVVISSRANYSSIKSVLESVSKNKNLTLQIVVGASALIDRFGSVIDLIKKEVVSCLKTDGLNNIKEAIGKDV